jgi:tetratricopeptide (TPR) repeat protein
MTPLFYAVYHGCRAGRHQETFIDAYRDRIQRGNEYYLVKKLGAFATDLSLLANFFAAIWNEPVNSISPEEQYRLVGQAGFVLRALGRLTDAIEPQRAGAEAAVRAQDWVNAGIGFANLSQFHLSLGNLPEAVAAAQYSIDLGDRGGDVFQRMLQRAKLADALHQSGDVAGARHFFEDAERLQVERQPASPQLYSFQGYLYCELLLDQGQREDVLLRASQSLLVAKRNNRPLDTALDHLLLGRAHPPGSAEGVHHLDQAVEFLKIAGRLDYLPNALLARGTPRDLDEVFRIATRSGMRLHLTDYHFASARLAFRSGDRTKARDHFNKAEALVQETGYHRRDPELAELRAQCT